ncbi:MAG: YoaK family protein [Solirubrobacteraceae bacterium]|nr:YoaK family protein [Solirubrobacteraceae bacterium]
MSTAALRDRDPNHPDGLGAGPIGDALTSSPDAETAPARTFPAAEADWARIKASERRRMLLPTLLLMTFATGVIDAVSYLALGSVFTANMTGNVVLIGFAFGGVPGFSITRTCVAVAGFATGSAISGRLSRRWRRHPFIWVRRATAIEIVLLALAALGSIGLATGIDVDDEPQRYAVIGLLAIAMGMRNATMRRLGFTDVPTTVLTSTITDFASDSRFGGGEQRRQGRRAAAIVAMATGALVGALLVRHVDAQAGFAMAIGLLLVAAAHQALIARRHPRDSGAARP